MQIALIMEIADAEELQMAGEGGGGGGRPGLSPLKLFPPKNFLECSVHVLITLEWLYVPPECLKINLRASIFQNVSGGGMPPDPPSRGMLKHALCVNAKLWSFPPQTQNPI